MKKNRKKQNKKTQTHKKAHTQKPAIDWMKYIKSLGITSSFIAVLAVSFFVYSNQIKAEHDLSVIGNGKATVVQIHDPNCQLCLRLQNNVKSVKGDFTDKIQFKTANIQSKKGQAFANRFNVPHVTLLFFNKKGRHVNTLRGVSSKQIIREALATLQ